MDKITLLYWSQKLKGFWIALTILLIFFGVIIYTLIFVNSKSVHSERIIGEVVSFHKIQVYSGPVRSIFIVKLKDNREVRVIPPTNTPIKLKNKVVLEKRKSESGKVTYEFIKYRNGS